MVLMICNVCFSQDYNNDFKAEYRVYNNTDLPNTMLATLYCHNNSTIYFENYNTRSFNKSGKDDGNTTIVASENVFEPYTKTDYKKRKIYLFDDINGNIFYVEDALNSLKWELTQETRDIAGYSCTKATTLFRGRKWIAWFAPKVAVPYGPWKLQGLPGLIMEAQDESNTYEIKLLKLDFTKSDIFNKEFSALYKSKNYKPIRYKEFVNLYEEYLLNTRAIIDKDKKGAGRVDIPIRSGKELKYEWEQ